MKFLQLSFLSINFSFANHQEKFFYYLSDVLIPNRIHGVYSMTNYQDFWNVIHYSIR
ncbi:hypothetical protein pb186bvf_000213 [Paramecium bursaria]